MNNQLLKSKKFRVATLAALSALLTFFVSEFGFQLDVEKTMTLIGTVVAPFLIYIGAEGYSEVEAKRVAEENKIRKESNEE